MLAIEHLQSFVAVAEELHFGRAAERMFVTQPSLSRRVLSLERQLDVQLFTRLNRRVALTPAGHAFLADARRILRLTEEAALNAKRAPLGEVGTLAIGFTAAGAYSYLGQLLRVASTDLPGVDVVLREMVSAAQLEALRERAIDLALIRPPVRGNDIASVCVFREPMVAAVPANHELAQSGRSLPISRLNNEPFIMYWPSGARYFHDLLLAVFHTAKVQPLFRQFVTQIHTALALVHAGVGITIVPAAAKTLHFDGVRLFEVTGVNQLNAELLIAWRPTDENPVRRALLSALGISLDMKSPWDSDRD